MTTSDTLTLIQTLFALCTCVLLIWYIVMTHRLQRQAAEQSRLQKEQLDLAKQELSQALYRERALLVPYIRWRGGTSSAEEERWEFENLGADVCNIRWSAGSQVGVQHEPRHLIRTFDQGSVVLHAKQRSLSYPLHFSLAFTNRFGEAGSRDFEITGPGTEPKEVLPYEA